MFWRSFLFFSHYNNNISGYNFKVRQLHIVLFNMLQNILLMVMPDAQKINYKTI